MCTGQIILTDHLVCRIRDSNHTLESLGKEAVSAWLKNELHWRIIDVSSLFYIATVHACLEGLANKSR